MPQDVLNALPVITAQGAGVAKVLLYASAWGFCVARFG